MEPFWIQFFSLSIISLRYVHVALCIHSFLLFIVQQYMDVSPPMLFLTYIDIIAWVNCNPRVCKMMISLIKLFLHYIYFHKKNMRLKIVMLLRDGSDNLRALNYNSCMLRSLPYLLSTYYVPLCTRYKRQKNRKA